MPAWVTQGFEEYARRMPAELSVQLIELPLAKRGKNPDIARAVAAEGKSVMEQIRPTDFVVGLEVTGKLLTTEKLATELARWQMQGGDVCFVVGGPDGNAENCQSRANMTWSLSTLTLPHPLVRVMLVEQLYRAWSINANHPYHRA